MAVTLFKGYAGWRAVSASPGADAMSKAAQWYWNNYWQNELPGQAAVFQAYIAGYLEYESAKSVLAGHGVKLADESFFKRTYTYQTAYIDTAAQRPPIALDPWIAYVWSQQFTLSIEQISELQRRGNISDDLRNVLYRGHGIMSSAIANSVSDLRYDLPSPGVFLAASTLGLQSPEDVDKSPLMAEYSGGFALLAKAAGLGEVVIHPEGNKAFPSVVDGAKYAWVTHWALPSYADVLRMQKRLRLLSDGSGLPRDPSGIVISDDDLLAIAKSSNIAPQWREALKAISYKPVSVRFLRTQLAFGELDLDGLQETLLDNGYNPAYVPGMAASLAAQVRQQQISKAHHAASGWIVQAWENGVIDIDLVASWLKANGYTPEQVSIAISDIGIRYRLKRVRQIISVVRRQFMTGKVSKDQAVRILEDAGVDLARITDFVNDWQLERQGQVTELTVGKLLSLASKGVITPQYFLLRLVNLNVDNDDIAIMMQEVADARHSALVKQQQQAQKQLLKYERELARREQQAIKQLEEAIKAWQQQLKQAQASLAKHGSPSDLKKWLCQGLISEEEVYARLRFAGWPDLDISRYLESGTSPCKASGGSALPVDTSLANLEVGLPYVPPPAA